MEREFISHFFFSLFSLESVVVGIHIHTSAHTTFQFRTHRRCVVGFAAIFPLRPWYRAFSRRPSIAYSILFCCLRHKVYSHCFVYGPSTKCNFSDLPSSMPISHTQLPSTMHCKPLISNVAHTESILFFLFFLVAVCLVHGLFRIACENSTITTTLMGKQ